MPALCSTVTATDPSHTVRCRCLLAGKCSGPPPRAPRRTLLRPSQGALRLPSLPSKLEPPSTLSTYRLSNPPAPGPCAVRLLLGTAAARHLRHEHPNPGWGSDRASEGWEVAFVASEATTWTSEFRLILPDVGVHETSFVYSERWSRSRRIHPANIRPPNQRVVEIPCPLRPSYSCIRDWLCYWLTC